MSSLSLGLEKMRSLVGSEISHSPMSVRLSLAQTLAAVLPFQAALRTRTMIYRLGGVKIGSGSVITGRLRLWGKQALRIGSNTTINAPVAICLDASVTIGSNVLIGHDVVIATGNHDIGPHDQRGGTLRPLPVVIEDGVWIGARATILPGVTVRAGSIVAAGAVVAKDVESDVLVGGVPAKPIREIEPAAGHPMP